MTTEKLTNIRILFPYEMPCCPFRSALRYERTDTVVVAMSYMQRRALVIRTY